MEQAAEMPLRRPEVVVANPGFEDAWEQHRRHLMDVAYRLLGSVSDSEDAVQEAYARLLRSPLSEIADVRAWLTTVVTRICLDQLRSARARREAYIGPWFPEPLVEGAEPLSDPAERITLDDSVRMAMLIVLEELTPAERVVFVLHEIFQFPFEDVARMVDRTPAACRQLASRARRHVNDAHRARPGRIGLDEQRRITERFIAAAESGDMRQLIEVLDPAVSGWADVGGRVASVREPIVGRDAVAHNILRIFGPETGMRLNPVMVNGEPGVIAVRSGDVFGVLTFTGEAGLIKKITAVADPRKLRHLAPLGRA
jgi:RNA polymerase sigma-70 factor (ECF subfamily)